MPPPADVAARPLADGLSSAPALGMLVLGVCGVAALVTATLTAWRTGRRPARPVLRSVVAAFAGLVGGALLAFFLLGFRHYGGNADVGDGPQAYACDAWWAQLSTPHGATDIDDDASPSCRHAAVAAVPGAVLESAVVGLLCAGAAGAVATARRRRVGRAVTASVS